MTRLLETLGFLAALFCACTVDNRIGTNDLPDAATICRGTGPSPTCPSTWELAQTEIECAGGGPHLLLFGHSDSFLAREASTGNQTSYCLYDPSNHDLAGGWRTSSIADFCNETATSIYYGVAQPGGTFSIDSALGPGPKCATFGECHGPLAEADCPATWQQAESEPFCPPAPGIVTMLGHAGGYLVRNFGGGGGGNACFYDAVTFTLAGQWRWSDVASYCDGTSFDILYGDAVPLDLGIRPGLTFRSDLGPAPCPDAGVSP